MNQGRTLRTLLTSLITLAFCAGASAQTTQSTVNTNSVSVQAFDIGAPSAASNRPDVGGTVGTDRVFSLQNPGYASQTKAGNKIASDTHGEFWGSLHLSKNDIFYDPRIVFDPLAQRYVATAVRGGLLASSRALLFGYSTDAAGTTWQQIALQPEPECAWNHDYPQMAVSRDFVVIVVSTYGSASSPACSGGVQQRVIVFRRNQLYGNQVPPYTMFTITGQGLVNPINSSSNDLANGDGRLYLVRVLPNNNFSILRVTDQVPQTGSGISLETVHASIPSPAPYYGLGTLVNQTKDDARLPVCDTPPSGAVVQGQLFVAYSTRRPTAANPNLVYSSAAWGQIDLATGAIVQSGVLDTADQNAILCPTATANSNGMLIGFTVTNANTYPSAAFVKRAASDPLGYMTPMQISVPGTAPYVNVGSSPVLASGDYSATAEDPTDPCTYWTAQQIGRKGRGASAWTKVTTCSAAAK